MYNGSPGGRVLWRDRATRCGRSGSRLNVGQAFDGQYHDSVVHMNHRRHDVLRTRLFTAVQSSTGLDPAAQLISGYVLVSVTGLLGEQVAALSGYWHEPRCLLDTNGLFAASC